MLDAAKAVLAQDGFSAFGVNAIARRAGCDKQLIYRYFGGLDGLVDAIALDLAALFGEALDDQQAPDLRTYPALIEHLLLSLLEAFRRSDLLLRVAAWEVFDPTPVTIRLSNARGQALAAWVEARRGTLQPPPGIDAPAINATLIAAVQHLALSARSVGSFAGVALMSDPDWERIRLVLRALVRTSYPNDAE
ncbi:MAG: TetR/AcrR family transcriptional regulator [Sphingomonadales bacterium]|nr:TetR/AcrR family transcriptional regulator [Sphingomonadales bacterium]